MSATAVPIRPVARGSVLKLWLVLALFVIAAAAMAWWTTKPFQVQTLPSGVRIRAIQEGTGPAMTSADVVALRYKLHVNSLESRVIQDSDESGQAFVTTTAEVFPGFAEGLQHMRAHGRYQLYLPPGQHITGAAPPGAPFAASDTLVFEIQVMQIVPGMAQARQMQQMQQFQQQMQQMQAQQGGGAGGSPHGGAGGSGGSSGGGAPPSGGGTTPPPAGGR
ncbi:MAG TPA: FKBP-type peptidyl-prolyl cis-trans isomerase [Allosphingosinicella sp.]